jgi:PAS domain S-box-containing protein
MDELNLSEKLVTPPTPYKKQGGLRRTLLLSFIIIAIVPLIIVAIFALQIRNNLQRIVEDKLVVAATLQEANVKGWIDEVVDQLVEERTTDIAIQTLKEFNERPDDLNRHIINRFQASFKRRQSDFDDFAYISLLDMTGLVKASTQEEEIGQVYRPAEIFEQNQLSPYIQPLFHDESTNAFILYIFVPVIPKNLATDETEAASEPVGVLMGKVQLQPLQQILQQPSGLQGVETYLVTPDNQFFNVNTASAQLPSGIQTGLELKGFGHGSYHNYEDEAVVGAFRWIDNLGVLLLTEQRQHEALKNIQQITHSYTIVIVLTGTIAILIAFFLTNRIISPINKLTQVATAIASGDRKQTINIQRTDEIGTLARAFNHMTKQLRDLINTLENRVARRTQLLETSAEVGRHISDILDLEDLLVQVVNLVKERFSYYHVQVFLIDDERNLVVCAGAGPIGQKMVAQRYRLKLGGKSLVGQAGLGELQLANDVSKSPIWLRNEFLPETKAELVLPLQRGEETIGVLDVQSDHINAFSDNEVTMLRSIADQLTIAVRNARLFQESETARRNTETLLRDLQKASQDLAYRSVQLHTAAQVSKATNTFLDSQELIQQVVELIKKQFNYYYVGLFLVDAAKKWAVLKAGTGKAGQEQIDNIHRLDLSGSSMVSWCIRHGQARIANDAAQDDIRYVNKYLPGTQAEIALPLIARGEIFGAISIQSTDKDAFSDEDIDILQTMSDHIATALQNAQLYSEAQASRARFYDLYNKAPAGYHTLSGDGTLLEINDTELKMLGYEGQKEVLTNHRKITDFMDVKSKSLFRSILPQIARGEHIQNLELVYVRPDESLLTVLMTATPIFDQQGHLKEIYASVQDITQLKEIEVAREALLTEANILNSLGHQLLTLESTEAIYMACIDAIKTAKPKRGIAIFMYKFVQGQMRIELVALWNNPDHGWPSISVGTSFPAAELELESLFLSGKTIVSTDSTADDRFPEALQQLLSFLQMKSLVGTPIWYGGKAVGFILVGNHTSSPFRDEAIRLFERVAQQMSVSLENRSLLEEAQQRANQLEAAAEVAKSTTIEVDLSVLLPQTVELIQDVFGYYHVSIFLVDDYQQCAILKAATGEAGKKLLAEKFKVSIDKQSIIGTAVIQRQVKITFDVHQENIYSSHPLLPETNSEVALPLIVRDNVIGILDVQNTREKPFNEKDVLVLQTIADQLANAIYVAHLFENERAATRKIQDLHKRYLQEKWDAYLQHERNLEQAPVIIENSEQVLPSNWPAQIPTDIGETKVITTDEQTSAYLTNNTNSDIHHSILAGPLTLRGQVIGSLGLIDEDTRDWSEEDIAIISAVSAQAALALENARLIEETEQRALQLQISAKISQTVTALLDRHLLLRHSVNLIQSRFNFARVYFYLVDTSAQGQQVALYKSDNNINNGQAGKPPTEIILSEHTLAGHTMIHKQTTVAQDSDTQYLRAIKAEFLNTKSALAIPLLVRQKLIGVLEIHSDKPKAFDRNQIAVLEILGSQIAISVENARAYQEQQEIAEQLREVDKLKTQFLANMSHELRTPLNSIIGFSRVILKGIDGPLTELQKTDLTSIYQSGQHLLGLINDILDLAKIEAGKLDLIFDELDLVHMINSVSVTATGLVKDKPIKIIQEVPEDLPHIVGDEIKIRQVLLNLLSNAAKFTEKGSITIKASHDQHHITISVTDTGSGIPEKNLATIFDPFTQVDASTTRKTGGTGLGLSITKKFIELHHGTISIKSKLKVGSTFTVVLPIRQPDDEDAEVPPEQDQGKRATSVDQTKPVILAIDHDSQVVDFYRQHLGDHYVVESRSKSAEAVVSAKALQPHVILLEILMPEKDGWTVIKELKENSHTAHIPVIICSMVNDHHRAKSLDVVDYLTKPISEKALRNALKKVITHNKNAKRVLIIDDRADDILLSKRILEARECQVFEASNGLDGLEIIRSNPPDLVILDLTMPDLDGFGVMEALKNDSKTADIPIIVITARDLNAAEKQRIDEQAVALLTKGQYSDADLLSYVDKIFATERV